MLARGTTPAAGHTFRRILIGTDGTERAAVAVSHGAELAARLDAELVIASAYASGGGTASAGASSLAPDVALSIAKAVLRDARKPFTGAVPLTTRALGGSPAEALARLAETERFDLVVTGNRGLAKRGRWFRRSVPERLLRLAPTHVLVVDTTDTREPRFERVVVATDGSKTAAKAVDLAASLAVALAAGFTIVTASPSPETGRRLLASVAARYPFADTKVLSGEPAESISRFAKEANHDVIVVGNRGMSGGRRLLLGSVPEALSRSGGIDLLIAKTVG